VASSITASITATLASHASLKHASLSGLNNLPHLLKFFAPNLRILRVGQARLPVMNIAEYETGYKYRRV